MGANEKFCLRWNDFESNISLAFREIREEKDFFDCTLSCGSRQLQAHKIILSACSPFFRSVLKQNPHQHPLLYLKGVTFTDLQAVLNFMYHGEVNIAQEDLNTFLAVAEDLKVKGLTQNDCSSSKPTELPKQRPVKTHESVKVVTPSLVHHQTPQSRRLIQDDQRQEAHPVVKTETVQQQQVIWSGREEEQVDMVDTQVASMDENFVEEDGYGNEGYHDEEQGYVEYVSREFATGGIAVHNEETEGLIQYANDQYECSICGRGFPLKITCRRHVQNVHSDNQRVLCHVCNKHMKNTSTLKAHLRTSHGIYQGGKSS